MSFGQRVHAARKQLGLSLNDLEQRTGVNKGYLSQLERENQRNPSVHIAKRIADALNLSLDDLLESSPRSTAASYRDAVAILPPALAKFVDMRDKQGRPLAPRQIEDLKRIQFRGEYPQQPEQYEILYSQLELFTRQKPKDKP
jgi:transcriptional regulator with XRE-family HTH domain